MHKSLFEAELAKAQTEHKKPVIFEFFKFQYAKLRKLELHYNFFAKICDVSHSEALEMDMD